MSSDRRVLKAMQRRLCDVIGEGMADAIVAESRGSRQAADALRKECEALGKELANVDAMLGVQVEKPKVQAATEDSASAALYDLCKKDPRAEAVTLCLLVAGDLRKPKPDFERLATRVANFEWAKEAQDAARQLAAMLLTWAPSSEN